MTMQQRVMLILMPAFLALYVLPILIAAVAVALNLLNGEKPVGEWFFYVLTEPNDPMAMMQRLLLPLTAGVTIVAMWSRQGVAMMLVLVGLTVLSLAAVVYVWWFLIVPDNALNLFQPVKQIGTDVIDTSEEFNRVARTHLLGQFEALAAYLAVLLGLSAKQE
jgi:hypothetical protein